MPLKEDLTKLASLKRSRRNLERIQAQLDELTELAEQAEAAESAANTARDALQELADALDALDDHTLAPWAQDVHEHALELLAMLPEDDTTVGELVTEATEAAEEYESSLDDTDLSADDREETWGALLDALDTIANAVS